MEKSKNKCEDEGLSSELPVPAGSRSGRTGRDRIVNWRAALLGTFSLLFFAAHWFSIPIPSLKFHSCHKHGADRGDIQFQNNEEAPLMDALSHDKKPRSQGVPLEAHIMSKCPDAAYCLQKLVVPTMEQVSDKVDFELSFIASVSNKSSDVECMHGPAECIGNMLMLCAANLPFPPDSEAAELEGSRIPTIRSLGFANCLIGSYSDIPDRSLVEDCAWQHGIDFDALNECVSRQEDDFHHNERTPLSGVALLRQSALHSAELGVRTSCTLRLDDTIWCVRDGGVWKDCAKGGKGSEVSVLSEEIDRLWKERN